MLSLSNYSSSDASTSGSPNLPGRYPDMKTDSILQAVDDQLTRSKQHFDSILSRICKASNLSPFITPTYNQQQISDEKLDEKCLLGVLSHVFGSDSNTPTHFPSLSRSSSLSTLSTNPELQYSSSNPNTPYSSPSRSRASSDAATSGSSNLFGLYPDMKTDSILQAVDEQLTRSDVFGSDLDQRSLNNLESNNDEELVKDTDANKLSCKS